MSHSIIVRHPNTFFLYNCKIVHLECWVSGLIVRGSSLGLQSMLAPLFLTANFEMREEEKTRDRHWVTSNQWLQLLSCERAASDLLHLFEGTDGTARHATPQTCSYCTFKIGKFDFQCISGKYFLDIQLCVYSLCARAHSLKPHCRISVVFLSGIYYFCNKLPCNLEKTFPQVYL